MAQSQPKRGSAGNEPLTRAERGSPDFIRDQLFELRRIRFGGSSDEMAKRLGRSRDTVKKWFDKRKRAPSPTLLAEIAHKLGVSMDWLVLNRGDMSWLAPDKSTHEAHDQLFTAVRTHLERWRDGSDDDETEAWLRVLSRRGPDALWREVVSGIQDVDELRLEACEILDAMRS